MQQLAETILALPIEQKILLLLAIQEKMDAREVKEVVIRLEELHRPEMDADPNKDILCLIFDALWNG